MGTERNRVLLVTRNFLPTHGGMERLMHHCYRELAREFDIALVGPSGCRDQAGVQRDVSLDCPLHPIGWSLACFQYAAWKMARRFRPAMILAGSGVMAPAALFAARAVDARAVSYVHGLDLIADNFLYQNFFVRALRKFDALIANSRNTCRLAKNATNLNSRIHIVHPGVSLVSAQPSSQHSFRKRYNLDTHAPLLLSVGRITPRKGLLEFMEHSFPNIVEKLPDCRLIIIGDSPVHSLKKHGSTMGRILDCASSKGLDNHLLILGSVDDSTLGEALAASDLMIFPVLDLPGDVEGFGMVAVEAAAAGIPTVAFAAGGVPDAIEHGVSGFLIETGNYGKFTKTIVEYFSTSDRSDWQGKCRRFAEGFAWSCFGEKLRAVCREVMA